MCAGEKSGNRLRPKSDRDGGISRQRFKILIKNRPTYLNKNLNTVKRETELKKG